ncbi:hypothetical protein D3C87_1476510 [compost metagenome]
MKIISLILALILSLNSVAWADPENLVQNTISEEREMELFEIAQDNPAEILAKMTDAELIQVAHELKLLVQDLQQDFSVPTERKGDKLGFTIHEWSKISISLAVVLTAFGIFSRTKTFKNAPDNPATYVVLIVVGLGVTAAIRAGNDKMVWMTPEEAQMIQEKIMRMRKFSQIIDRQLK